MENRSYITASKQRTRRVPKKASIEFCKSTKVPFGDDIKELKVSICGRLF